MEDIHFEPEYSPDDTTNIAQEANTTVIEHTNKDTTTSPDSQDGCQHHTETEGCIIKQRENPALFLPAIATIDDAMKWVKQTDPDNIANEWVNKIQLLDAAGKDTVKRAVSAKTGFKLRPLNAQLKAAAVNQKKKKIVQLNKKHSAKLKAKNIVEIEFDDADTRGVTMKAASAIVNDKDPARDLVLRYGSDLVSIQEEHPKTVRSVTQLYDKNIQYPKMPIIRSYVTNTLRHRLEQAAAYVIRDKENGDRKVQWPKIIVETIGLQHQVKFPQLTGIVEHPFVGLDGTIVKKQGYDEATGLYAMFDPILCKNIPLKPTEDEVANSLEILIKKVLADFPFVEEIDKITAVAALLTAIQIKMIADDSGSPGFLFDAPTPATGKTTLAQIISYSIYGRPAAATSWTGNDTEMAKHILSILKEGHSCVLFDNLPEGSHLKSNELAKAMTGSSYSGRLLGGNKTATVPSNVLWLFTGNNINICSDFNTRILPIRLDSRIAAPDRRRFIRQDVGKWCLKHRADIIRACITIILGDGSPTPASIESTRFRCWDRYVRLPLLAASGIDIADLFQRNKTADPEVESKRHFLEAMYDKYGGRPHTAKDICKDVDDNTTNTNAIGDVFSDVFPENSPSSSALGIWLGKLKGQILGGYRLTSSIGTAVENKNRSVWAVEKVDL